MSLLQKWNPLGATRWSPFKEMEDMQERLARMIELSPLRSEAGQDLFSVGEWSPLVDISESDQEYLIKAELPEVKKDDVKISVENGVLKISGERQREEESKSKKLHRIERSYGRFVRCFSLPEEANASKVTAEFKDGLLKVHVPKDQNVKPKAVEIKVS
jgi:HSP20 family protein